MKTLLKVTLLTTGILAAASSALAVDSGSSAAAPSNPPTSHRVRDGRLARRAALRHHLAKKLGLTDAQKAQLKNDRASTVAAIKAIRADSSLTPDQKKAKIRDTVVAARGQMRTVLTPEQQAKLHALRARWQHRHPHRG